MVELEQEDADVLTSITISFRVAGTLYLIQTVHPSDSAYTALLALLDSQERPLPEE